VRLALVSLVIAVAALGCGGSGDSAPRAATPSPTASAPPSASAAAPSAEASARRRARLKRIGRFDAPVYVTSPPGGARRVFVVEQPGTIRIVKQGRKLGTPFLDIRDRVRSGGEQGLLSMAFAPDYAESGLFYVDYTDNNGDSRIVEYQRASKNRADPGSARELIFQRQPEPNHNGGLLLFGPDRRLYVGFGDGGGAGDQHGARGNAQNLGTLLGKILRIDPRPANGRPYSIPDDNPFLDRPGARDEIWLYGVRNPWRFSFDPRSGSLVVADVGQGDVEEVTIVPGGGANLGWRPFEGNRVYTPGESAPGHVRPVIERLHSDGNCSITGGVVVRDRRLRLRGRYLFGDYCTGIVESARLRDGDARRVRRTRFHVPLLSSFGEDARGRAYVVSLNGPVYRLVPR
jgi:glucose/arabinose dehydrogenase